MKKLTIASFLAIICAVGLIAQDGAQTNIGAGLNSAFTAFISPSGVANGPILLTDGTQPIPSLVFKNETGLGYFRVGSTVLGLTSSGATTTYRVYGGQGTDFLQLNQASGAGIVQETAGDLKFQSPSSLTFTPGNSNAWQMSSAGNFGDLGTHAITAGSTISGSSLIASGTITGVANVGANSCGTTTATILGSNNSSVITVGATAGTQCRLQFSFAATTAWDCTANDDTTTIAVRTTPVDTTHTDVIGTFTAGDKVTSHCFPR